MTIPSYNAISFQSKEEHLAALYDACLLIVNTYNQSDMLDLYSIGHVCNSGYVSPRDFMRFARNILNQIAKDT